MSKSKRTGGKAEDKPSRSYSAAVAKVNPPMSSAPVRLDPLYLSTHAIEQSLADSTLPPEARVRLEAALRELQGLTAHVRPVESNAESEPALLPDPMVVPSFEALAQLSQTLYLLTSVYPQLRRKKKLTSNICTVLDDLYVFLTSHLLNASEIKVNAPVQVPNSVIDVLDAIAAGSKDLVPFGQCTFRTYGNVRDALAYLIKSRKDSPMPVEFRNIFQHIPHQFRNVDTDVSVKDKSTEVATALPPASPADDVRAEYTVKTHNGTVDFGYLTEADRQQSEKPEAASTSNGSANSQDQSIGSKPQLHSELSTDLNHTLEAEYEPESPALQLPETDVPLHAGGYPDMNGDGYPSPAGAARPEFADTHTSYHGMLPGPNGLYDGAQGMSSAYPTGMPYPMVPSHYIPMGHNGAEMPQVSRGHMAYNSGYPQAQWQASYGATNPGDSSYPMEGDGMPLAPADGASPAGNSTSGNQTHENGAPTHTNSSHMVPFPGQPRLPMYTGPFYPSMVPPGAPNYGPQPIYYPNQPHPMQYQNNMHRHTPSGSSGGQMGGRGRVGGRGRGSKPFSSHRGGGVNGGSARGGYRPTHYNQRSSPPTSAQ